MPISLQALTWEERERLLSKSQGLSRKFPSADPLPTLPRSGEETTSSVGDGGKNHKIGDCCSPIARIRSLEEIQAKSSGFLEKQMATLLVASRFCGKDEKVVIEVAAFDEDIHKSESEDVVSLSDWLFAMREHIEEQVKWGVEAFGHEVYIPEATSLTKHGTVICASTIPDIPAASLEALCSSTTKEVSEPPVTVL
ncbi:unnamed protein product [Hydatigera taeniaeformis]|uniref:START domain-containing protein n=1 Tax=Hydatigena taeniaeformis TaxID=6205 RepID=A0A0R3WXG9_HYDTA|nr:unnamed protein product [Hydatigera taeniaeformis]